MVTVCPKCGAFKSDNQQEYNIYKLMQSDRKLCNETFKNNILYDWCDNCSNNIILAKFPGRMTQISNYVVSYNRFNAIQNDKILLSDFRKCLKSFRRYRERLLIKENRPTDNNTLFSGIQTASFNNLSEAMQNICDIYKVFYAAWTNVLPKSDEFILYNFWKMKLLPYDQQGDYTKIRNMIKNAQKKEKK